MLTGKGRMRLPRASSRGTLPGALCARGPGLGSSSPERARRRVRRLPACRLRSSLRPRTASTSPSPGAVAVTRRGRDSPGPWAKPLEGTGREDGPARSPLPGQGSSPRRKALPWPYSAPSARCGAAAPPPRQARRGAPSEPTKGLRPLDPRGKDVRTQGVSVRATRNPMRLTRLPDQYLPRSAERRFLGLACQEPPRSTRRPHSPDVHALPSRGAPA